MFVRWFFFRQHICPICCTSISTDDQYGMSDTCAPLHANLFRPVNEADIRQGFLNNKYLHRSLIPASAILMIFCHGQILNYFIYTNKHGVTDTTDTQLSASYLDLHPEKQKNQ